MASVSECMQPEVNEEFLRVFVKHVLFPLEAAEQPEEIDPELHQVQHDRLRAAVAEVCQYMFADLHKVPCCCVSQDPSQRTITI